MTMMLLLAAGCGRTVPWSALEPDDLGAPPVEDLARQLDLAEIPTVDAARPPEEECNGRDDDGDGIVDEKCVQRLAPQLTSIERAHIDGDRVATDHFFYFNVIDLADGGITKIEEPKADGGTQLYATDGDLRGGWLAWRAVDAQQIKGYGLRARHLPTGRHFEKSDVRFKDYGPVQVDDGRVVFAGRTSGADTDIWLWDTASGELRLLSFSGPIESAPDIAGPLVVWERRETEKSPAELRALDLETGRLLAPSDGLTGSHQWPATDGNRVIWRREWTDPATPDRILREFWLYDAKTETRRRVGETFDAGWARIDGDRVCWIESKGIRTSTWVHDLSTSRSLRLSTRAWSCDISGNRVVMLEHDTYIALYLRELQPDEP